MKRDRSYKLKKAQREIGFVLSEFRRRSGIKQEAMSRLLGISQSALSRRETGENSTPVEDIGFYVGLAGKWSQAFWERLQKAVLGEMV